MGVIKFIIEITTSEFNKAVGSSNSNIHSGSKETDDSKLLNH